MVVDAKGCVEGVPGKTPGAEGSEAEQKQHLPEIFQRQDQTPWTEEWKNSDVAISQLGAWRAVEPSPWSETQEQSQERSFQAEERRNVSLGMDSPPGLIQCLKTSLRWWLGGEFLFSDQSLFSLSTWVPKPKEVW